MKLIYKIVEAIKESEHEVVLPLYDILDGEINQNDAFYIKKLNRSLDELQEMYDKAEKVHDLEGRIAWIDELIGNIDYTLSDMRSYTDV